MDITEVRFYHDDHCADERLLAYVSVTFDGSFVVRDLRLIQGRWRLFLSMPSRLMQDKCPQCHRRNALRAKFCQECGVRLADDRAVRGRCVEAVGRPRFYADVAHPVNPAFREKLEGAVLDAWDREQGDSPPVEQPFGYGIDLEDY